MTEVCYTIIQNNKGYYLVGWVSALPKVGDFIIIYNKKTYDFYKIEQITFINEKELIRIALEVINLFDPLEYNFKEFSSFLEVINQY